MVLIVEYKGERFYSGVVDSSKKLTELWTPNSILAERFGLKRPENKIDYIGWVPMDEVKNLFKIDLYPVVFYKIDFFHRLGTLNEDAEIITEDVEIGNNMGFKGSPGHTYYLNVPLSDIVFPSEIKEKIGIWKYNPFFILEDGDDSNNHGNYLIRTAFPEIAYRHKFESTEKEIIFHNKSGTTILTDRAIIKNEYVKWVPKSEVRVYGEDSRLALEREEGLLLNP